MTRMSLRFCRFFALLFMLIHPLAYGAIMQPTLVLDMRDIATLPKNFRTSKDKLPAGINTTGLAGLHMAGSGQFSKMALDKVLATLNTDYVFIIDLRQESHGFIDGTAISWYAPQNAANVDLTMQEIDANETQLLAQLNAQRFVKPRMILEKTLQGDIAKSKPVDFSVGSVSTEKALAEEQELDYKRIYVQDYHAPTPRQVDRFIQIVRDSSGEDWIYFHCRGGVGRTTVFMAMLDMMHNAKRVSFEDILARQAALGGKNLTKLPAPTSFKYQAAVDRLLFLQQFYDYARNNHDGFATSWSEYIKS